MTPEQVKAITDMNLTRRDMSQVMQGLGIATGEGCGQNLSSQQIATFQARRSQNGGNGGQFNRISPALYDALFKLLQGKK